MSGRRDIAAEVARRYYGVEQGRLLVGGLPAAALAEEFGTPLYVYARDVLDRKWGALRTALPDRFEVYYSMKANPNQAFLRYFRGHRCGIEIASGGELRQALEAGCPAGEIVFAGPGKTHAELERAVEVGVGELHVESALELERIDAIGRRAGRAVPVAIRVNPDPDAQGGGLAMGGVPAPFGVDEEVLEPVVRRSLALEGVRFSGIHVYLGTQILEADTITRQYGKALDLARRVAGWVGGPIGTLDFGGGFGIPYFGHEREIDLEGLAADLDGMVGDVVADPRFAGTRFVVEPGRFLVGEAGIYVARVVDIKVSRGRKYIVVDGGMNHHLAASGNLGQTIKRNHAVALLDRLDDAERDTVHVAGPLCTPLDTLARDIELPRVEVGDLVGIFQSGAYARTASPLGFLSHPAPPEVWIEGGRAHLIRRRGREHDPLADQEFFQPHFDAGEQGA